MPNSHDVEQNTRSLLLHLDASHNEIGQMQKIDFVIKQWWQQTVST